MILNLTQGFVVGVLFHGFERKKKEEGGGWTIIEDIEWLIIWEAET